MIRKEKYKEFIFEVIIPALILALLIRTFVVQAFKIPSESMVPTLQIGDHLFVCKFSYGLKIPFIDKTILKWNSPKRGDVIVFRYPEDPKRDFIKRTIGLYGETFQVINKEIYINGTHLIEPYKIHNDFYPSATQFSPRDNWERSKIILPNRVFLYLIYFIFSILKISITLWMFIKTLIKREQDLVQILLGHHTDNTTLIVQNRST